MYSFKVANLRNYGIQVKFLCLKKITTHIANTLNPVRKWTCDLMSLKARSILRIARSVTHISEKKAEKLLHIRLPDLTHKKIRAVWTHFKPKL